MFDSLGNAVDLFFVLSGFVLANVYESSFATLAPGLAFRDFIVHRVARLVPLYALTTLLCFVLLRAGVDIDYSANVSVIGLVANLLMVQQWGWPSDSINMPGWSISTEWEANLLFPLLVILVLRSRLTVALGVCAVAAMAFVLSELYYREEYWSIPIVFRLDWFRFGEPLIGCLTQFMFGMLSWRLRSRARWTSRLGGDGVLLAVLLAIFLWIQTGWVDLWFGLLASLLVIGLSYETSRLSRLLGTPVLHGLGVISFSIYLIHMPVWPIVPWLQRHFETWGLPHAFTVANWLGMGVVVGLAPLTFHGIERPARRLIRLWFSPSGPAVPRLARAG